MNYRHRLVRARSGPPKFLNHRLIRHLHRNPSLTCQRVSVE